ncbi:restriction endonuclease subunit S [Alienimonas sp. DA493]|uniref:restriction endonuclease subunit S n=1 Tax=Alienimonas sp. DA493 TaxID=3373605 RepID=UPI003754EF52
MDAAEFLEKFDTFADLPRAAEKLRVLVLHYAAAGRLCRPDESDESIVETFPDLADDVEENAGRPGITFGRIGDWRGGGTPRKSEASYWGGEIPWVSPKDMKSVVIDDAQDRITQQAIDNSSAKLIPEGSLLMVVRGMILARSWPVATTSREVAINQDMKAVTLRHPELLPFVLLVLRAMEPTVLRLVKRSSHGTCKLKTQTLQKLWIPLPPLAEQRRIVAAVERLTALCDRLEAEHAERDARGAALARAATARFAADPTPETLETLFHESFDVSAADLRTSVLSLAAQGHLVPQDSSEGDANVRLAELEDSGGNPNVRRRVPKVAGSDEAAEGKTKALPANWALRSTASLLHLGALTDLKDGNHGANHPKVSEFSGDGLPFITAAQVSNHGGIDYDGAYKVGDAVLKRLRVGFAEPNDVIYTHKGSVGRVAICDRRCVLSPQTTYYRVDNSTLTSDFLHIFLQSPSFTEQVDNVKRQTTRDFVAISKQYSFQLHIPPLAEQRRIVAKADALLALIDRLETQQTAARDLAARTLDAAVAALVR